jgi:hypothetical protein
MESVVRSATGNDGYEFGDFTRSATGSVERAVSEFTGNEAYEFGDISRKVLGDADRALASARDEYFDALPAAMWKRACATAPKPRAMGRARVDVLHRGSRSQSSLRS